MKIRDIHGDERMRCRVKQLSVATIIFALSSHCASAAARLDLGDLGPKWIVQTNVMDEIWVPVKLTGTNYFAFGAPVKPNTFAARSDPSSPLYQAWFGGYAIKGGKEVFASGVKAKEFDWFSKFAELDQVSWLGAMGDPRPNARWVKHSKPQTILIDGEARTLYIASMVSDSDVSESSDNLTGLAKSIGMPQELASAPVPVKPFHPLTVKGLYAFWYDSKRDMVFVVYAVASAFKDSAGQLRDNYPSVSKSLRTMMRKVKVID
jgi:hypothetical protein